MPARSNVVQQAVANIRPRNEPKKPAYLMFSKVGRGWQKIGAVWRVKSGEDQLSGEMTALPMNWDGRFLLAIPDERGEVRDMPDGEIQD